MNIFRLVKKVFYLGLTILSNFTNALSCNSVRNQDHKLLILIVIILYFTLLASK